MKFASASQFHVYLPWGQQLISYMSYCLNSVLNVRALGGAFSMIVKTSPMVRLKL